MIRRRWEVLETQEEGEGVESLQEEGGLFPSQVEAEAGRPDHFLFFLRLPLLQGNQNLQP